MGKLIKSGVAALVLAGGALVPGMAPAQDDSTPSTGVFKTAEEIHALCVSEEEADLEACDWYLMAAHDMIKLYGDTETGGTKLCIPEGTQAGVIREVVLDYWRADPDGLQYSAVSTIYNALEAEYVAECLPNVEAAWPAMSHADTLGNMRVLDAWQAAVARRRGTPTGERS